MWPAAPCSIQPLPSSSTMFHITLPLAHRVLPTLIHVFSVSMALVAPGRLLMQLFHPGSLHSNCLPFSSWLLPTSPSGLLERATSCKRLTLIIVHLQSPGRFSFRALAHYCNYIVPSHWGCVSRMHHENRLGPRSSHLSPPSLLWQSHPPQGFKHHHHADNSQMQIHISTPDSPPKLQILTSNFLLGHWPRYT